MRIISSYSLKGPSHVGLASLRAPEINRRRHAALPKADLADRVLDNLRGVEEVLDLSLSLFLSLFLFINIYIYIYIYIWVQVGTTSGQDYLCTPSSVRHRQSVCTSQIAKRGWINGGFQQNAHISAIVCFDMYYLLWWCYLHAFQGSQSCERAHF